jgi:hypothetical protein
MDGLHSMRLRPVWAALVASGLLAACAAAVTTSKAMVTLSGGNEVPPVTTAATGDAWFTVDPDWTVKGKVTTRDIAATAAHIHEGRQGANGPVIVPLVRTGDNEWSVPPGTRLKEGQLKTYREGGLYVNVHSSAYPGGEIRGQLTP